MPSWSAAQKPWKRLARRPPPPRPPPPPPMPPPLQLQRRPRGFRLGPMHFPPSQEEFETAFCDQIFLAGVGRAREHSSALQQPDCTLNCKAVCMIKSGGNE